MLETLLLILMLGVVAFAAVNVTYALLMVTAVMVRALMSALVVPLLKLVGRVISLPFHLLGWILRGGQPIQHDAQPAMLGAGYHPGGCRCDNPPIARFCRHCGRNLRVA